MPKTKTLPANVDFQKTNEEYTKLERRELAIKKLKEWSYDPVAFVEQCIGVHEGTRPGLRISRQQREGLEQLGALVRARVNKWLGKPLTEADEIALNKVGISIMSGHGTGKDAYCAWVIMWWLTCFPNPRGLCTAPTEKQLSNILFAEVVKWQNLKNVKGEYVCKIRDSIKVTTKKVMKVDIEPKDIGKSHFFEGRTASPNEPEEKQGETLAGVHEDFMITIAEEASGVPDPVFKPVEGGQTGICNIIIIIFNPTKSHGFAYNTQRHDTGNIWCKLHWNAEESENVDQAHVQRMKDKHGPESNTYRIRVLGLPPRSSADTLIPFEKIEMAVARKIDTDDLDPLVMGVDCSLGGDEAVLLVRRGPKVIRIEPQGDIHDTDDLGAKALKMFFEYEDEETGEEGCEIMCIDSRGVGAGVYAYCKRYIGKRAVPVDVARAARNDRKFYQLRDELWWKGRELVMDGVVDFPNDEIFQCQLSDPKAEETSSKYGGRIKVESKQKMKKRGKGSPDRAEAWIISLYRDDSVLRAAKKARVRDRWRERMNEAPTSRTSWMAAGCGRGRR